MNGTTNEIQLRLLLKASLYFSDCLCACVCIRTVRYTRTQNSDLIWCLTPCTSEILSFIRNEHIHVWQSSVIMSLIMSLKCLCRNEWNKHKIDVFTMRFAVAITTKHFKGGMELHGLQLIWIGWISHRFVCALCIHIWLLLKTIHCVALRWLKKEIGPNEDEDEQKCHANLKQHFSIAIHLEVIKFNDFRLLFIVDGTAFRICSNRQDTIQRSILPTIYTNLKHLVRCLLNYSTIQQSVVPFCLISTFA